MNSLIEKKRDELDRLCGQYRVQRLELFGSGAGDNFDPQTSDLDFLVEFHRTQTIDAADQYFGLLFDLERLFGRHIDLVCATAMRNPFFIKAVNDSRKLIYAA